MVHLALAKYGKDLVRVFRVIRGADGVHRIAEYTMCVLLEGDIAEAWTDSDNRPIVATDSILNTCRLFAKQSAHVLQPETFALELGLHFVNTYAHIHKAHVDIVKLKWSRIPVHGKPHAHSFVRDGEDKRFTNVVVDATKGKKNLTATLSSGLKDLLVLKTTGSKFENFLRDKYTTLPEVSDRLFSTAVDCQYTIPIPSSILSVDALNKTGIDFEAIFASVMETTLEIFSTHDSASVQATLYLMAEKIIKDNKHVEEVTYKLPNKHYFAVNMDYIGVKNTKPADAEVFHPVADPSGLIVATISRDAKSKL